MVFDLFYDYEACFVNDPTLKESDIQELKKWVESQEDPGVFPKDLTEKQLLLFYTACERNIMVTQKCIKSHYTLKAKSPDTFDNRDVSMEDMVIVQEAQEYIYLPRKTDTGHGVMFYKLYSPGVDKYDYIANCKFFHMTIEAKLNEDGPDKGMILLYDMAGTKFGHMTKTSLGDLRRFLAYTQEGLNVRIEAIHILNVTYLFSMVVKLIRPFMKGEFMNRMVVHSKDMDWEAFYRDFIPKKCLPSDYGGDLEDTKALNKWNAQRLSRNQAYFDAEQKQRHSHAQIENNSSILEKQSS